MKVGISSWSVPWSVGFSSQSVPWSADVRSYPKPENPVTASRLLDIAANLGVSLVQFADNLPLHELSREELTELGADAHRRGISVEVGSRRVHPDGLAQYLEIAKTLGAHSVWTLAHTADSKPSITQVETWIGEVLPSFERAGVSLAIENNDFHAAKEYGELVRDIDSPYVNVCMDTANSLGRLEFLEQIVEELAPYTTMLHAKDFSITRAESRMGFSIDGCAAGDGDVNFDWLFDQLRKYDRDPSVVPEHWLAPEHGHSTTESIEHMVSLETEWVERSVRFLNSRTDPKMQA